MFWMKKKYFLSYPFVFPLSVSNCSGIPIKFPMFDINDANLSLISNFTKTDERQ